MLKQIRIKIVIVGDQSIEKTSVLISYTQNQFPTEYIPSVFQNYSDIVRVGDTNVTLILWDTAGQEQYSNLRRLTYDQTDVFFITFSVIDQKSFQNARKKWFPELQQYAPNALKIFLGSKINLRDENKYDAEHMQYEKAKNIIWQQTKSNYYECNVLTREGLRQVFDDAIERIIEYKFPKEKMEKSRCKYM